MFNVFYPTVLLSCVIVFNIYECKGETTNEDESYINDGILEVFVPTVNQTKCNGQTICKEVNNYPKDYIEQLLLEQNITQKNPLFGKDFVELPVASRFNIMSEGDSLCRSRKEIVKPQAGWNEVNNNWFFLVNHGPYEQAIEVDICEDAYKPCNMNDILPKRTECRQKYIYRKMLAFDGKMEVKNVKLPACCSCRFFEK